MALSSTLAVGAGPERPAAPPSTADGEASSGAAPNVQYAPAAYGLSGALRVRLALPGAPLALPLEWSGAPSPDASYRWRPVLGTMAPLEPAERRGDRLVAPGRAGVYELEVVTGAGAQVLDGLRVVVPVPESEKRGGRLRGYRIGDYPGGSGRYAPPAGYIEVTPANQDLLLSEHFRLREFLTKDQADVWPKYVVVDERLLDKLELVLLELESTGVRADHMIVMSGYRTPQYNRRGLGAGRAQLSRHQYGDAADIWVDNDGDWYMDDLNGDGRRDTGDARVMLRAVERVEARHPELVGGAGIYPDNGAHGPFIHIDTRGRRARW